MTQPETLDSAVPAAWRGFVGFFGNFFFIVVKNNNMRSTLLIYCSVQSTVLLTRSTTL